MSLRRPSTSFRCLHRLADSFSGCQRSNIRRHASTSIRATDVSEDVDPESSLPAAGPSKTQIESFDPLGRAASRQKRLPRSRYSYLPPRYYRGPLHPIQPPKPSDPASREFIPGPFSLPRLEEAYHSTLAPDLLTLMYTHHPPGSNPGPKGQRLRTWDDSSPYHKNRPLRGPRGGPVLPLMDRPITFRNVPRLEKINVHSFIRAAGLNQDYISVASMVLQAITNVRATVFPAKHSVANFNMIKGRPCAVGLELTGENMYEFLGKLIEVVMPRIKEWQGVSGSSGDSNGNLSFGFEPEVMGYFPEIEVNYDAYPPKMIPGMHVSISTTATNDKDARLLLASMGIPFYGKHRN